MIHVNDGACIKCEEIMNKYAGFVNQLKEWFLFMQAKYPMFHTCDAGRGKREQELFLAKGASKARWGQSSHNYNAALDTFFLVDGKYSLDQKLYDSIAPEVPAFISWYGAPGAKFYERPHFEIKTWREMVGAGEIKLVE